MVIYSVPEKIAQSLCTTILQLYVTEFSPKYSERNCLHDKSQCRNTAVKYNTAIKYSLLCSSQVTNQKQN